MSESVVIPISAEAGSGEGAVAVSSPPAADMPSRQEPDPRQRLHELALWQGSNGQVDLIVVGPGQKRAMNQFVASNRRFTVNTESFKDLLSVYESDFGVCRIIMSRWVPAGTILFLDSTRINVMPLSGRSFHYKRLATTGDREGGQIIGEYTLELRNENAHGVINGLAE